MTEGMKGEVRGVRVDHEVKGAWQREWRADQKVHLKGAWLRK